MSLFSEPRSPEPAKPEPNSTPFTDGIEKMAALMSDSSDPNIGSPSPTGTPVVTDCMTPPSESPSRFASRMAFFMAAAASGSGHLTSLPYIAASSHAAAGAPYAAAAVADVIATGDGGDGGAAAAAAAAAVMATLPICCTYEQVSTPIDTRRSFLAIAPPITCVAVSRPENLPPPR